MEGEKVFLALCEVAREREVAVTVRGGSMEPAIAPGSRVWVRARARYLPGDVLVFAGPGEELTVHRYLGPLPRARLLTQGDATRGPDAAVARDRVVGRVVRAETADAGAVSMSARLASCARWVRYVVRRVRG